MVDPPHFDDGPLRRRKTRKIISFLTSSTSTGSSGWSRAGTGPGVNFINILRAAFTHADPESAKNSQVVSLFMLL